MEIRISKKQVNSLKSSYKTKYVDNSCLYKSPSICKGINQNLNKLKVIDIYEKFGELVRKNKDVFRRENPIGKAEDGSFVELYSLCQNKSSEKPIILIVGGVHGDEKTSVYGIYKVAEFLLGHNRWSRFIKENFIVNFIPCLNVYGFNNNKRNNSNNKDLNRDFDKQTQSETKALINFINKNKGKIKIILDSHNAYNEEFVSCKQEMKYFEEYEDVAFKINLFLNGKYESNKKRSFLWISRSQNDGTLSDFINKNKFIGHTVESPRSLTKEIHYPNPINYEDGAEVTIDLLINLMYIYGKMHNAKIMTETKQFGKASLCESNVDELQAFHGSHSDFDKFNHKKYLSSGTGSQTFGWGTYVTDDNAIAQSYANNGNNANEKIVYEVEIPEDNGDNYLNWDDRLTNKQKQMILNGCNKIVKSHPYMFKLKTIKQSILNDEGWNNMCSGKVYRSLESYLKQKKAVSLFLNFCGFDGVKYKAGTIYDLPNNAKEGAMNYVIFDANKVKITNKNRVQ